MNKILQIFLGIVTFIVALLFQSLSFFLISYFILGYDIFTKAFINIKNKEFFDENTLMIIATVGAFIIGEYSEAVLVIMLYQIGESLSDYAIDNSKEKISALMDLRSSFARIVVNDKEKKLPPSKVKVGDFILVKPGEIVPLDGVCLDNDVSLDTKSLTGEARPLIVNINDEVLSGSIVISKPLKIKVTKVSDDSTVNKIVKFMKDAEANKTKTESFITRFSKYYTPIVCFLALVIFLVPTLLGYDYQFFLYKALIFLVISCPCALVISVPLSFFSGIGRCSKEGILVKNTVVLEKMSKIDKIYYDKTGTLTTGEFKVNCIVPNEGVSEAYLKELVTAAEIYSNHPLSKVLTFDAKIKKNDVTNLEEVAGKGINCIYKKKELLVGRGFKEGKNISHLGTVVFVYYDGKEMGYIVISDEIKVSSKTALDELNDLGIKQIMLTGDREKYAKKIAKELNINYKASLLPVDKAEIVKKFLDKNKVVAFVGDGINDAPALVTSDIGISMGSIGSDVAMEASDVILMHDDLRVIPKFIKISKYTNAKIRQNIIMALFFKVLILVLGLFTSIPIYLAIFADVGVMLITILNSLLVFKKKFN